MCRFEIRRFYNRKIIINSVYQTRKRKNKKELYDVSEEIISKKNQLLPISAQASWTIFSSFSTVQLSFHRTVPTHLEELFCKILSTESLSQCIEKSIKIERTFRQMTIKLCEMHI